MDELAISREEAQEDGEFTQVVAKHLDGAREVADALATAVKSSERLKVSEKTICKLMQGMYNVSAALTSQAARQRVKGKGGETKGRKPAPRGPLVADLVKLAQGVKTLVGAQQTVAKLQTLYQGRRKRAMRASAKKAEIGNGSQVADRVDGLLNAGRHSAGGPPV